MDEPLWRYSAGAKGANRVTVYERTPHGPLWVQWWPHGIRKRQPLRLNGQGVRDRKVAMSAADSLARRLEQATAKDQLHAVLGLPERHTLGQLLTEYHAKRGGKWTSGSAKHQRIMRDFWLRRLGANTDVLAVKAGEVEQLAREAADANEWTPRTEGRYLKYLKTAFNFGRRKLKWYGEAHDLSAVDIPRPDSVSESYSTDEVRALLPKLLEVDLRAAVAGWMAYESLRRITAIRTLRTDGWRTETRTVGGEIVRLGVQRFGRKTDKAKKSGEAWFAGRALELAETLLQSPAVQASGLWFPAGSLADPTPERVPARYEMLNDWLAEAEKRAEVPHIPGRSWHAFKRAGATDAEEETGSLAGASEQAGTLRSTLERHYVKRGGKAKAETAVRLARRAGEA